MMYTNIFPFRYYHFFCLFSNWIYLCTTCLVSKGIWTWSKYVQTVTQIELSYNVLRNLRICVHTHETYFRQDAEVRSQFEDEQKATSEYKQVQYECQSLPNNYLDVLCNHYPFGLSTARTILQAALFRFVSKGGWVTFSTWAVINIWHFSGLGSLL